MSLDLKKRTQYVCPVGAGRPGHSSVWTGDMLGGQRPGDDHCVCGEEYVEENTTADGYRYRLEFEQINSFDAQDMEENHGRGVWPTLDAEAWAALRWHPTSRESDTPHEITAQYETLRSWAETHEQPIRNVRLLRLVPQWEAIDPEALTPRETTP